MKKILLLFFIFISINAFSQLQVKEGSFKYVPGGVIDDKEEYTDGNELPMALIKISTENINEQERMRLVFTGNRATQIIKKPKTGQMWIYISAESATFIDIKHPDYGTCKYYLPETLCDYCVYEMVLQYLQPNSTNNEASKPRNTYLVIKTDQEDAAIFIDGQFAGTKQTSKSFDIGSTHTWKIECDLYHEEIGTVTLNEKTEIVKTLRPAYGYLNVNSKPENEAIVYIDNKKVGTTPYKSDRIASGTYSVRVMKEMYQTEEQIVVVTDNLTTDAVLNMKANFVEVTIKTDPESLIYVDEEYKGKGTWKGRLTEGAHFVEAKKKSHETSSKNINLVLGKNETIDIKDPEPIYGFLDVNSNPMSANIYLNGKSYGQTPNVISDLLIGDYELKLQIEGYHVLKKNITIKKGETLYLNEILEKGKDVNLKNDAGGNKIYVDGKHAGCSPLNSKKESWSDYMDNGVNFFTIDGSYSRKTDFLCGFTWGSVDKLKITNYYSVMLDLDLLHYVSDYFKNSTVNLDENNKINRLSLMYGIVVPFENVPMNLRFGAGVGIIVKYKPSIDIDTSMGLFWNYKHFVTGLDFVSTDFKTFEIKLSLGVNWKK